MTHAIALTAHHDDAVLWCGGTILRTLRLGWRWTVVALCVPDPERQVYFDSYCAAAGVAARRFQFQDYQLGDPFSVNSEAEMTSSIQHLLGESTFDFVFTHSRDESGEYGGHTNHDEVRNVTTKLVAPEQVIYSCYGFEFGFNGRAPTARLDAEFHLQLTYDELIQKAGWCRMAPDCMSNLQAIGFSCPNPEGFRSSLSLPPPFIPK